MDLINHLVPPPLHGQGRLPLDQVAQSPIQVGLEITTNYRIPISPYETFLMWETSWHPGQVPGWHKEPERCGLHRSYSYGCQPSTCPKLLFSFCFLAQKSSRSSFQRSFPY